MNKWRTSASHKLTLLPVVAPVWSWRTRAAPSWSTLSTGWFSYVSIWCVWRYLKPLVLSEADMEFVKKNATAERKWIEMGLDQWKTLVFFCTLLFISTFLRIILSWVKKLRHQEKISTTTSRDGRDKSHVWSECDFIFPPSTCFQQCWPVCCRSTTNWLPIHFYQ